MIPTAERTEARLAEILARGSVNLGEQPDTERLLLMLTRSCELRCGYCFVNKSETEPVMPLETAKRSIDLLMRSKRSRLEIQVFGGEPTRSWDTLLEVLRYGTDHPLRLDRKLEIVVTTNGLGLDPGRIARLSAYPVVVLFSVDGDEKTHERYRNAHLLDDQAAYAGVTAALGWLRKSTLNWFANVVLPPSAAGEVMERYRWAVDNGVPRLQLNYAVGMKWSEAQTERFLSGLEEVLRHHHRHADEIILYNWRSAAEPVMLSDDLIVDVDGTVLHDGAIFLERAFGELKQTYRRGHLDGLDAFDPLRWDLKTLERVMVETYPAGSEKRGIIEQNIRLGAAVDLLIEDLRAELQREAV